MSSRPNNSLQATAVWAFLLVLCQHPAAPKDNRYLDETGTP